MSCPKLVKQRYGTELRSRTLASIKPEISQALTSLLDEIRTADDAKIMRTAVTNYRRPLGVKTPYKATTRPSRPTKSCPLCKQAGRPDNHFLSETRERLGRVSLSTVPLTGTGAYVGLCVVVIN